MKDTITEDGVKKKYKENGTLIFEEADGRRVGYFSDGRVKYIKEKTSKGWVTLERHKFNQQLKQNVENEEKKEYKTGLFVKIMKFFGGK